jgi:long-chain acyl-CoA synthetase
VVVPRADVSAATLPATLKAFCAQRLSDYKVPETFTVVPGPLPRNANGKLLKTELRASRPGSVALAGPTSTSSASNS